MTTREINGRVADANFATPEERYAVEHATMPEHYKQRTLAAVERVAAAYDSNGVRVSLPAAAR